MDGGIDKLKSVDWRGLIKTATNKVKQYTLNLSPLELKVEDATNMETWGPHGSVMGEIAEACYDPEGYRQVLGVIARRLQEKDEHWRMCYKALLLLEHLIKHGPMKVAQDVSASMSVMERLQRFQYKDENSRDHGANVRHRAQEIITLVTNGDRLREEREKARVNRDKYRGVSAAEMRMGGFSSHSRGSSYGGGGGSRFDPASLQRPGGGDSYGASVSSSSGSGRYSGGGGGYGGSSGMTGFGSSGGVSGRYDDPQGDRDRDGSRVYSRGASASVSPTHMDNVSARTSPRPAHGAGGGIDPVSATRARIEKLKVSAAAEAKPMDEGDKKKKLHDIKVNPKIAASLGLKLPTAAAPGLQTTTTAGSGGQSAAPSDLDLLGGLMDDTPAPADAGFASFGDFPTEPALDQQQQQPISSLEAAAGVGGWDAFGGGNGNGGLNDLVGGLGGLDLDQEAQPTPHSGVSASTPLDIDFFGSLSGPAPVNTSTQPVFDPFAAMPAAAPGPTSTTLQPQFASTSPPSPGMFAAAKSPPKGAARAPSPADTFAELTGIHKGPAQPMGEPKGLRCQPPPLTSTTTTAGTNGTGGLGSGTASPTFAAFASVPAVAMNPDVPAVTGPSKDPFEDLFK